MSIPRQKTPKDAFAALGAICMLCAIAVGIAAGVRLADDVFQWELFFVALLAFVNGLALIWLGEWSDWMKTRMAHLEQGLPPPRDADVRADPDNSLNSLPRSDRSA